MNCRAKEPADIVLSSAEMIPVDLPPAIDLAADLFFALIGKERIGAEDSVYQSACLAMHVFFAHAPLFAMEIDGPPAPCAGE